MHKKKNNQFESDLKLINSEVVLDWFKVNIFKTLFRSDSEVIQHYLIHKQFKISMLRNDSRLIDSKGIQN